MPLLQVRDVPEHLYRLLVRQAEKERRSIAQQAIAVLSRGLGVEVDAKARRKQIILEIQRSHPRRGRTLSDPVKLIREDRNR